MSAIGMRAWFAALAMALLAHLALAMAVTPLRPSPIPMGGGDGLQVGLAAPSARAGTAASAGPPVDPATMVEPDPTPEPMLDPEETSAEAIPEPPEPVAVAADHRQAVDPVPDAPPATVAEAVAEAEAEAEAVPREQIPETLAAAPPPRKPAAPARTRAAAPATTVQQITTSPRAPSVAETPPKAGNVNETPPKAAAGATRPASQAALTSSTAGGGAVADSASLSAGPRFHPGAPGNPPPRYPESARRQGREGQVILAVRLAPDGSVLEVQVDRSSGHRALDDAARAAVRRWRFQPAVGAAQGQAASVHVPITFRLTN